MRKYFGIIFVLLYSYGAYALPCSAVFLGSDKESSLLKQGFSQYYAGHFNEAVQLVKLKKKWIKKGVKPEDTHIPYFAKRIETHIAEVQRGIEISDLSDGEKFSRLQTLKALEKEAFFRRKIRKFTSHWWNIFNIRLVMLTADSVESAFNLGLSLDQIQDYQEVYRVLKEKQDSFAFNGPYVQMLEQFPNIVLVPIISDVGPMAFNQVMSESIHFIGISGASVQVDGKKLSPQEYVKHDVEHAASIEQYLKEEDLSFHSQFKLKVEDLPKEIREDLELAYFLLLHERGGIIKGDDNAVFHRNFEGFSTKPPDIHLLPSAIRDRKYKDKKEYKQVLEEYFHQIAKRYITLSEEIKNSN